MTMKHKINIIWGTEAVRNIEKPEKGYTQKTYTFSTEKELNCFLEGVDEANGWLEYFAYKNKKEWQEYLEFELSDGENNET